MSEQLLEEINIKLGEILNILRSEQSKPEIERQHIIDAATKASAQQMTQQMAQGIRAQFGNI